MSVTQIAYGTTMLNAKPDQRASADAVVGTVSRFEARGEAGLAFHCDCTHSGKAELVVCVGVASGQSGGAITTFGGGGSLETPSRRSGCLDISEPDATVIAV